MSTPLQAWPVRDPDCVVCQSLGGADPPLITCPPPERLDEFQAYDRIRGVLVGGALGDAAGRLAGQGQHLDLDRLTAGGLETGGATQLSLFTAEGLLRMLVRYDIKGIGPAFLVMRHAYDGWVFTQQRVPSEVRQHWASGSDHWPIGWLVRRHELHVRRDGFGGTIAALGRIVDVDLVDGELQPRVNTSKGSGAVVRAAPIGLLVRPELAFEVGIRNAGYTHGGATAYLAAGFLAALVARLVGGIGLSDAVDATHAELQRWPHSGVLAQAVVLARSPGGSITGLSHASSALCWGLRASLGATSLDGSLSAAIGGGGTAAAVVAGSIWGAAHGAAAIPGPARVAVDVSAPIEELVDAIGVGHRAWVMGRPLGPAPDGAFGGSAAADLLWTRFLGY